MPERFQYATHCVDSDGESIEAMIDRAREITLSTFRRRCDTRDWEHRWYGHCGMRVEKDWHLHFYRSQFRGLPCYYVVHSAIEYVWTPGGREHA